LGECGEKNLARIFRRPGATFGVSRRWPRSSMARYGWDTPRRAAASTWLQFLPSRPERRSRAVMVTDS
jgi:hypothetical protein